MPTSRIEPISLAHTPTRHRLLTEISQPDNEYEAHVDLVDQTRVTFRLRGERLHGAITQALRLFLQLGAVELPAPPPFQHHRPRTLSLTVPGHDLLTRWPTTHERS